MAATRDPHAYLSQYHLTDGEHRQWSDAFSAQARCAQIDEDLFAARSVSVVLVAIVACGTLLGALGVAAAMLVGQ